jgi:hypothetical protein
MYEFTRDLRHVEVMLSNELESHYRALHKAGTVPPEPRGAYRAPARYGKGYQPIRRCLTLID